jgi:hypothetical protein
VWVFDANDIRCTYPNKDIPTTEPSPPIIDDPVVAAKDKYNDEIRIGPISRAHDKLLEQQVNSLLIESNVYYNDNFILPKSFSYV